MCVPSGNEAFKITLAYSVTVANSLSFLLDIYCCMSKVLAVVLALQVIVVFVNVQFME